MDNHRACELAKVDQPDSMKPEAENLMTVCAMTHVQNKSSSLSRRHNCIHQTERSGMLDMSFRMIACVIDGSSFVMIYVMEKS